MRLVKRFVVVALESACVAIDFLTLGRTNHTLARLSGYLDERWDIGVWRDI